MRAIVIIGALLVSACGELPGEARHREQQESARDWAVQQEIQRQRAEPTKSGGEK